MTTASMPWENDPIVGEKQEASPWENDPIVEETGGVGEAMSFVNKAIAGTLGAPADIIGAGLNLIPGATKGTFSDPFLGSKSIGRGMSAMGINLPEEGREPKTVSEHVGRAVGEASAMLLPAAGTLRKVSQGVGLAGDIARTFTKSIAKHPYIAMASELTGGAGAGAGRYVGEKQFPDSPGAQATAEIVGGVAGGIVPTVAAHMPTAFLLRTGQTLFKKGMLPFTKRGSFYRAGEAIKGRTVDPIAARARVGEETIGDLPPAVASGEKELIKLYKSLIGQDPKTDFDAIEDLSKSIVKLDKEMRKMGYGAPEVLAEITEKRIAALELRMDNRVLDAMAKAQNKVDALPVAKRQTAESVTVRNELEQVMKDSRATVREAWADVPKNQEVGFENTRASFAALKADLAKSQHVDIPQALKTDPIIKGKKHQSTNVREMQGLRSKLLETARSARKEGQWNKARIADEVADAILDDLDASGGSSELRTAIAATRQFKTRFEQGVVGKVLGYSKSGAPAISPELTLDVSIGRMGAKGSIDIDKIAVTPEARAATERYLTRSYTDYANKTGAIDPSKSKQWIKNNEDILDQFTDLRSQLSDAAGAQELANSTKATMDIRKAALRNPKISIAAKFVNAADMGLEIDSIFKANNPLRMTKDLMLKAAKDTSGDATAGLRAGFIDYMLEKSSVGGFNEIGEQALSGRTLLNLTNKNDHILRQVFNPEQITRMKQIGRELSKIETFEKVSAGKPDIELKDAASSAITLFGRVTGARLGGWLGRESAGGSLQMAQIISGKFKTFLSHFVKDKAVQMVNDAILSKDPSLLKALLLPIDKPKTSWKNLVVLDVQMNLWLAGTGKRVMDDIEEEAMDYINIRTPRGESEEQP